MPISNAHQLGMPPTEVQRFFWRNYLAHSIEGGLYMGGLAFLSVNSVLPRIVQSLGGPNWLIAFMPTMLFIGFSAPPLFTAHLIERLERMKPVIMVFSIFARIPGFVAALALWFLMDTHETLVLVLVVLAQLLSGLIGGCTFPAWMELVARTVPKNRLSSLWAIRFVVGSLIGLCAGAIIKSVLTQTPGGHGYAILHLYAAAFGVLSYLVFLMIRETSIVVLPDSAPIRGLVQSMCSLPELLREDPRLRDFLAMRMLGMGILIVTPFLAIHILESTCMPDNFLGRLVQASMVGAVAGNLSGGWLGDRYGGRLPTLVAIPVLVMVMVLAMFRLEPNAYLGLFFLLGIGSSLYRVGVSSLFIEISPVARRPTYTGLVMIVQLGGMLMAAGMSWGVRTFLGTFWPAGMGGAICLALCGVFLLRCSYGAVKNAAASKMAAQVDESTCTGCEACVGACPTEAIVMENGKAKGTADCIDCGVCVDECPVEAITMD